MNHAQHRMIKNLISLVMDAQKWGVGFDTTGEGLHHLVPQGHIRIIESIEGSYRKGGFTVLRQTHTVPDGARTKQVTFVLVDLTSASSIPSGYVKQYFQSSRGDNDPALHADSSRSERYSEDAADRLQSVAS